MFTISSFDIKNIYTCSPTHLLGNQGPVRNQPIKVTTATRDQYQDVPPALGTAVGQETAIVALN